MLPADFHFPNLLGNAARILNIDVLFKSEQDAILLAFLVFLDLSFVLTEPLHHDGMAEFCH